MKNIYYGNKDYDKKTLYIGEKTATVCLFEGELLITENCDGCFQTILSYDDVNFLIKQLNKMKKGIKKC
tara:strand:+ start:360 stop:566 length:207 start_codon:yes stop_codon:yes gene_type:complete